MYGSIEQVLSQIREKINRLKAEIEKDEMTMETLREQGLIYAGTWMKAGKYMYLIFPSDGFGYRERRYIGADPAKIKEAMDGIERGKEYNSAKYRRNRNRQTLDAVQGHLFRANETREPNW